MSRTLIVADDLSGAADCAIAFRGAGETKVAFADMPMDVATLSVDADTRRRDAVSAADATHRIFAAHAQPDTTFYKKMDSTLRGHVGAEIAAARQALAGLDPLVIVAPAYPATGRTMTGGRLFVHGVPVEQTQAGRELTHGADLCAMLGQAGLPAVHVDLETLRSARLHDAPVMVCDSETGADLRRLVATARRSARTILWAGSGGLARVLAGPAAAAASALPMVNGRMLFLVGSQSSVSHVQARRLGGFAELTVLRPEALLDGTITLPSPQGDHVVMMENAPHLDSHDLIHAFAELCVAAAPGAEALFLTGGETARAVLGLLAVPALRLLGEIEPGVIVSRAEGGRIAGRIVVTKAGAFGTPQALRRVQRVLRGARRPLG